MKEKLIVSILLILVLIHPAVLFSQHGLHAGFDAYEYKDLMKLGFESMNDSLETNAEYKLDKGKYKRLFRSPEVGLFNKCEVFLREDNVAVITIRGTIGKAQSWLENFYAGMVNATGELKIDDTTTFAYKLSANDRALVHVGWLVGLAYLSPYINKQIDSLLEKGIVRIIIMGHSQGGALAFLTTSYLYYKYREKNPTLQLKTYASAAPKPGNMYYAYDFDFISRDGYGYRVVNSADWVPETPITVQTTDDFNEVNPVTDAKKIMKKQKLMVKLAVDYAYGRMCNGSYKAMKRYRKYLGIKMSGFVKKTLTQYQAPTYAYSVNYMTAGCPVILNADSAYYSSFKFDGKDYFVHHMPKPYFYLLDQYYTGKNQNTPVPRN